MWVILPAVSLAIVHIAGDNLAVVPTMAPILGTSIYSTAFIAYIILGAFITGISAWVGVKTGQELIVVVRKVFGCVGKKAMALTIMTVCIPASALTGGYFSGWVLSSLVDISYFTASIISLVTVSVLAAGWGNEFLRISNYFALLLIPALAMLVSSTQYPPFDSLIAAISFSDVNWPLVLALIGYNAGGMRAALVVEAASYLTGKEYKAIVLAVLAKFVEGVITLLLAHVVLITGSHGPTALSVAAGTVFDRGGLFIFNLLLLSTFINTMVPAMIVNARQIGIITGLSYRSALAVGTGIVCLVSLAEFQLILTMMSATGLLMTGFILLTAVQVHKLPNNES